MKSKTKRMIGIALFALLMFSFIGTVSAAAHNFANTYSSGFTANFTKSQIAYRVWRSGGGTSTESYYIKRNTSVLGTHQVNNVRYTKTISTGSATIYAQKTNNAGDYMSGTISYNY